MSEELINLITSRALTFSEVLDYLNNDKIPFFIEDIPVWARACIAGCPEFFVGDLIRMERAMRCGRPIKNLWPFVQTIRGFSTVSEFAKKAIQDIPPKLGDISKERWDNYMEGLLAAFDQQPCTTTMVWSQEITDTSYHWITKQLQITRVPTLYKHVPLWLYACRRQQPAYYVAELRRVCEAYAQAADVPVDYSSMAKALQGGFDARTELGAVPIELLVRKQDQRLLADLHQVLP